MSDSSEQTRSLETLWQHVSENWEENAAHSAFISACSENKRLPFAAEQYRSAKEDPARQAVAEAQLQAIVAVAMASIDAQRGTPKAKSRAITIVGVLVSLSLILASLWLLLS